MGICLKKKKSKRNRNHNGMLHHQTRSNIRKYYIHIAIKKQATKYLSYQGSRSQSCIKSPSHPQRDAAIRETDIATLHKDQGGATQCWEGCELIVTRENIQKPLKQLNKKVLQALAMLFLQTQSPKIYTIIIQRFRYILFIATGFRTAKICNQPT